MAKKKKTYPPRKPRIVDYDPEKHCGHIAQDGLPCTLAKGWGTDHLGTGRCKWAGGGKKGGKPPGRPPITGIYSKTTHKRLRELIAEAGAEHRDPLDLVPEINQLRALNRDFIDRYQDFADALMTFWRSYNPNLKVLLDQAHRVPADREEVRDYFAMLKKAASDVENTLHERPRQILDITDAAALADKVGRLAERIHKMQEQRGLSGYKLQKTLEAVGQVVGKQLRKQPIDNPDGVMDAIQAEWDQIDPWLL